MRLREPSCTAIEEETERVCGVTMHVLGERDPTVRELYDHNPQYRSGWWVFRCPRCGALRALSKHNPERYAEVV